MCIRDSYVLVLIALINTIISLYYYLMVVKSMFLSTEDPIIETFRSSCADRIGMWICTAGVIALGLVSYFYNSILTLCQNSGLLNAIV